MTNTDLEALKTNFTYLQFKRINPAENEFRYYYLGWQPTLFHAGAVVRIASRQLDGRRHIMAPLPFSSFDEAWPTIRAIIRKRLRNGYRIVREDNA